MTRIKTALFAWVFATAFTGALAAACSTPGTIGPDRATNADAAEQEESEQNSEPVCDDAATCWKIGYREWKTGERSDALGIFQRACELDSDYCSRVAAHLVEAEAYLELRQFAADLCRRQPGHVCASAAALFRDVDPADLRTADDLLVLGCKAEDPQSCFDLAVNFERGFGRETNKERAIELYRENCARGEIRSCKNLAILWVTPGRFHDEKRAVAMFEKICDHGDMTTCADLGDRLVSGRGVKQDVYRGLALLERACDAEDGYGCAFFGKSLLKSSDSVENAELAFGALKRGCSLGSGRACLFASRQLKGRGVGVTTEEQHEFGRRALAIFEAKCAQRRSGRACGMVASILRNGDAGHTDPERAEQMQKLGCEYDKRVCDW